MYNGHTLQELNTRKLTEGPRHRHPMTVNHRQGGSGKPLHQRWDTPTHGAYIALQTVRLLGPFHLHVRGQSCEVTGRRPVASVGG